MTKGKNFSCNNINKKRKKSDFYETPYSITKQLLEVEPRILQFYNVLEPACGNGAIVKILESKGVSVTAKDITTGDDFLKMTVCNSDAIITNPPFSLADEFIKKAKTLVNWFAFLLPLSYLHGKSRYDAIWMDKSFRLESVYVFTRYPMLGDDLRPDGKYRTGMMVYAWYIWNRGYTGEPTIRWIDNHKYVLGAK